MDTGSPRFGCPRRHFQYLSFGGYIEWIDGTSMEYLLHFESDTAYIILAVELEDVDVG